LGRVRFKVRVSRSRVSSVIVSRVRQGLDLWNSGPQSNPTVAQQRMRPVGNIHWLWLMSGVSSVVWQCWVVVRKDIWSVSLMPIIPADFFPEHIEEETGTNWITRSKSRVQKM